MASQHQNASLYVGDLPPDVTEAMLFDLFKAVGPVLSIRVCRDAGTRRSLGYAYVNFQNPLDAERALETLNYNAIKGKPIRIMWSHRDPGLRKSGSGNVFIKNLHETIDNQTLYDTFSQFGNILSCKVSTDQSGKSRGYGFVHFESEESAKAAIEKVNGMLLKSLQVYVGRFVRRAQRQQQTQQEFTNIYIKEMKEISEDDLKNYFGQFGEIVSSCLKTDRKGRPFGFINYKQHESAVQAVEKCNDQHIPELCAEGRKLFVCRAQKKSERTEELLKKFAQLKARRINEYSGSNLYVKNLDDTIDDKQLRSAFERFGDITSAKVMLDDKFPPQSKGFGFVCFRDVDAANKAINEMNGHIMGSKPLYVNIAQRKEVRRATLEIQYAARMTNRAPGVPAAAAAAAPTSAQPGAGLGYQQMYPAAPYFAPPSGPAGYPYMFGAPAAGRGAMMAGPKWAQHQHMPGSMPFPSPMPGAPQGMPARPPQMGAQGAAVANRRVGARPAQPQQMGGRGAGIMGGQPVMGAPRTGIPPQTAMAVPGAPAKMAAVGVQQMNFVYNQQARNKETKPAAPATMMGVATAGVALVADSTGQEPLSSDVLAGMSAEQQKNALGERLFARISETHPDYAAKITGMLLEMDVAETLNLLESPDVLNGKIEEALEVLKAHEGALAP